MVAQLKQVLGFLFLFCAASVFSAQSASGLSNSGFLYRNFALGTDNWQVSQKDIVVYSSATNSVKRIQIEGISPDDTIFDAALNDGMLWLAATKGLFSVETGTGTIIPIPFVHENFIHCKLAVDGDYVWLASADTLWQFDKLAKEWISFPLAQTNSQGHEPLGCLSINEKIYCLYPEGVQLFSVSDEKWRSYPTHKDSLSRETYFLSEEDGFIALDKSRFLKFESSTLQWVVTPLPAPVIDIAYNKAYYFLLTNDALYKVAKANNFLKLVVAGLKEPWGLALVNDTTVGIVNAEKLELFTYTNNSTDFIDLSGNRGNAVRLRPVTISKTFFLRCEDALEIFSAETRSWNTLPLKQSSQKQRFSWNENGCRLSYSPSYESSLHGEAGIEISAKAKNEADSTRLLGYKLVPINDSLVSVAEYDSVLVLRPTQPTIPVNLTLHTKLGHERYLDAFFDNTNVSAIAQKGVRYQGAQNDVVAGARVLSNAFDMSKSQLLRPLFFEGVSADLQSTNKLADRDRRIATGSAGYGKVTSQTRYRHLTYDPSGTYSISLGNDSAIGSPVAIIPGSFKVWVDGELLGEKDFSFSSSAKPPILNFSPRTFLDKRSSIIVSYKVGTVPDSGYATIEALPENTFGNFGYAQATVSPTAWISAQGGYLNLSKDSLLHTTFNASLPLEIRHLQPEFVLLCTPELALNQGINAKAGAVALNGRFGKKISFSASALLADTAFMGTEQLSKGLGALQEEFSAMAGYDILQEVPLSYQITHQRSQLGSQEVQKLVGGVHFSRFPLLDIELSRIGLNTHSVADSADSLSSDTAASDSVRMRKDKLKLTLYETEAEFLKKLTHANQVGYELSYTRFSYRDSIAKSTGQGTIVYGQANISPVKAMGISTIGSYTGTEKSDAFSVSLNMETLDLIKGIELNGTYTVNLLSQYSVDSSSGDQTRSAELILRPGVWIPALTWFSPLGGITQKTKFANSRYLETADLILVNDSLMSSTLTRHIGAQIMLGSNLQYRNDNTWTQSAIESNFYSYNDAKIWFKSGMLLQTRYELQVKDTMYKHIAWSRLDQRWTPVIQTMTQYDVTLSETPHKRFITTGPQISFIANIADAWWIMRSLQSTQLVKVRWKSENGTLAPWSEISFATTLQAYLLPNVIFGGNTTVTFASLSFASLNGTIYLKALF